MATSSSTRRSPRPKALKVGMIVASPAFFGSDGVAGRPTAAPSWTTTTTNLRPKADNVGISESRPKCFIGGEVSNFPKYRGGFVDTLIRNVELDDAAPDSGDQVVVAFDDRERLVGHAIRNNCFARQRQ
jgi:hypothetical protein